MADARSAPTSLGLGESLPAALHYPGQLVRLLVEEGHSRATLLAASGVTETQIVNPQSFVSLDEYRIIIRNALRVTGNPALGLWFGRQHKLASMGVLGLAALSSPTLSDAAQLLTRFASLRVHHLEPHVELPDPTTGSTLAAVRLEETHDYGDVRVFLMEATMQFLAELGVTLLSRTPSSLRFDVTYARPLHWRDGVFPHPVRFEQPAHRIYGSLDELASPLPNAEPASAEAMQRMLEERLVARTVGVPLVDRVRQELERAYRRGGDDLPTAEELADILGCSARTLRRALGESGSSYREVANEVRCALAKRALADGTQSIEVIARRLGYQDSSNFRRAFRQWTGHSPSAYRKMAEERP